MKKPGVTVQKTALTRDQRERLRELLSLSPRTPGGIIWRLAPGKAKAGEAAGTWESPVSSRRRTFTVDRTRLEHARAVCYLTYGFDPGYKNTASTAGGTWTADDFLIKDMTVLCKRDLSHLARSGHPQSGEASAALDRLELDEKTIELANGYVDKAVESIRTTPPAPTPEELQYSVTVGGFKVTSAAPISVEVAQ